MKQCISILEFDLFNYDWTRDKLIYIRENISTLNVKDLMTTIGLNINEVENFNLVDDLYRSYTNYFLMPETTKKEKKEKKKIADNIFERSLKLCANDIFLSHSLWNLYHYVVCDLDFQNKK